MKMLDAECRLSTVALIAATTLTLLLSTAAGVGLGLMISTGLW
jgi:hypothetical protein